MPEPRRITTAPLAVRRDLGFGELATVVAADALVRRAWAAGRQSELVLPSLGGDLAGQYALDRQLARDGHDRDSLTAEEYEARAATFDEARLEALAAVMARVNVAAPVGAASVVADDVVLAARTAFVKLYEEGQIEQAERVVLTCPRCRTPLDSSDAVGAEVAAEAVTLRLRTAAGAELDIALVDPEMLVGVVAVGVPEGDALAGESVLVPLVGREVPVIAEPGRLNAGFLVPAHDADAYALAGALAITPVAVLDVDGVVCADGPLAGLGRFAARSAARELLVAEGAVVAFEPSVEQVWRCASCGTVLVPQLGRHWFLRSGDLEVAAADAVRDGSVEFTPADARDAFLAVAGVRREWCLSSRVAGGVAVPAMVCLDCGKLTVDVLSPSSCGKCMGPLVPEAESLAGRFVAAVWSLALHGWPARRDADPSDDTIVVVGRADLAGWVLPSLALGIRLAGGVPFCGAVVHPWPDAPDAATDVGTFFADEEDRRVMRLVLVAGTGEVESARAAVAGLDRPVAAGTDGGVVAAAAAEGLAALDAGSPAQAAGLLSSALAAGVPEDEVDRLRALALPILGD